MAAVKFGEPGVFIAFEETEKDLEKNTASLGFHLRQLVQQNKLFNRPHSNRKKRDRRNRRV
jgi:KaiC/GvpD/RAD55 family RecA-like ATPase